jgi:hypothetical protein
LGCIYYASIFLISYLKTLIGARVARNFGLEGQEIVRNPEAREPERLFLVGWEFNQFG